MNQFDDMYRNDCNDDLFMIFFDRLITLHIKKDYDGIDKILIGNDERKSYNHIPENSKYAKYIDKDTVVPVRVWTDNETRKYLNILYYVCKDEDMTVSLNNKIIESLNNKIIESWLYEMDDIMSRFFYKSRNITCSRDCRLTLKVENRIWNEFVLRCDALNITQLNGFKTCVNDFIEQKAKMYL